MVTSLLPDFCVGPGRLHDPREPSVGETCAAVIQTPAIAWPRRRLDDMPRLGHTSSDYEVIHCLCSAIQNIFCVAQQGLSWRLQWGSDICTFSCCLLILSLPRYGQKSRAARHPSAPPTPACAAWKHVIGLRCQTEGQVGTQSPLILCAPACNLHVILQNAHKFFALLFPLPFFLLSETRSSHSPDCFCVSFIERHIACRLFSHAAAYTFLLPVPPTFLSSALPLLQMFSCRMHALIWFHQNGLTALTPSISSC